MTKQPAQDKTPTSSTLQTTPATIKHEPFVLTAPSAVNASITPLSTSSTATGTRHPRNERIDAINLRNRVESLRQMVDELTAQQEIQQEIIDDLEDMLLDAREYIEELAMQLARSVTSE